MKDLNKMKKLYAKGLTVREVGVKLGIGYSVVYAALKKDGVEMRSTGRRRLVDTEKLAALLDAGSTLSEAAAKLKVSVATVSRAAKRLEVA